MKYIGFVAVSLFLLGACSTDGEWQEAEDSVTYDNARILVEKDTIIVYDEGTGEGGEYESVMVENINGEAVLLTAGEVQGDITEKGVTCYVCACSNGVCLCKEIPCQEK